MNKAIIEKLRNFIPTVPIDLWPIPPSCIQDLLNIAERSLSAQDEVLTKIPRFNIDVDVGGDDIQEVPYPTGDFCRFEDVQALLAAAAPSPAVAVEPVAYLRFRAAQQWSGVGGHDIEHAEWFETCHAHEIGDDKQPAFPVYATPSPSLAVRDIPREPTSEMMEAANRQREVGGDTKDCWRAMWDAAMREQT